MTAKGREIFPEGGVGFADALGAQKDGPIFRKGCRHRPAHCDPVVVAAVGDPAAGEAAGAGDREEVLPCLRFRAERAEELVGGGEPVALL